MSVKKVEMENLPTRIPVRVHPDTERHYYSNKLGTKLRRFIESSVGKKWDCIYSEIKKKFKKYIERIPSIINWYVDFNYTTIDGRVYNERGKEIKSSYWGHMLLYVDQTGILKKIEPVKYKRPQKKLPTASLNGKKYICYQDIWYEIETVPIKNVIPVNTFKYNYGSDVFLGEIWNKWDAYNMYGDYVRAISKRQINKREKKALMKHVI